jgi:hypothetical protein
MIDYDLLGDLGVLAVKGFKVLPRLGGKRSVLNA